MRLRLVFLSFGLFLGLVGLTSCNKQYLRGYYTWDEFQEKANWKTFVDEDYKPNPRWMDSIKGLKIQDSLDLELFLGTYCKDSKRWVPRFFRVAPELPLRTIEIISLDTTKKDSRKMAESRGVDKIPTFIFFQNGEEVGRLVEKPKGGLEKKLYYILKNL